MGGQISAMAFWPPHPSYGRRMPNLVMVDGLPCVEFPSGLTDKPSAHTHRLTVLMSHGNAEDIGQLRDWLNSMTTTWNVNFFAYDYEGYGLHQGKPSEASVFRDVEKAWRYLTVTCGIPPSRIVLLGRSLGSGPTVHLASKLFKDAMKQPGKRSRSCMGISPSRSSALPTGQADFDPPGGSAAVQTKALADPSCLASCQSARPSSPNLALCPAGMILVSPLTSAMKVVSPALSYALYPLDFFANGRKMHAIECPTLIIHGVEDDVVPASHGASLADESRMLWRHVDVPRCGHNDPELIDERVVAEFLRAVADGTAASQCRAR
eukprot:TRINITY_DN44545_c0_g1_i1.p1 TRINITY_DN44545_c0_g1~~TRINITY_DN44545_c0_g1_i1.p1  ORF type:complete len:322 (+),score=37.03 TRINITY_DN44545_c0_g1_i1:214-1179(+)